MLHFLFSVFLLFYICLFVENITYWRRDLAYVNIWFTKLSYTIWKGMPSDLVLCCLCNVCLGIVDAFKVIINVTLWEIIQWIMNLYLFDEVSFLHLSQFKYKQFIFFLVTDAKHILLCVSSISFCFIPDWLHWGSLPFFTDWNLATE